MSFDSFVKTTLNTADEVIKYNVQSQGFSNFFNYICINTINMAKEITDTNFSVSLKTLGAVGTVLFLMIGEYIVLQEAISEAKRLPDPPITRIEYDLHEKSVLRELELIKDEIRFLKTSK